MKGFWANNKQVVHSVDALPGYDVVAEAGTEEAAVMIAEALNGEAAQEVLARKARLTNAVASIFAGLSDAQRNTDADLEGIVSVAIKLEGKVSKRVDNGE